MVHWLVGPSFFPPEKMADATSLRARTNSVDGSMNKLQNAVILLEHVFCIQRRSKIGAKIGDI